MRSIASQILATAISITLLSQAAFAGVSSGSMSSSISDTGLAPTSEDMKEREVKAEAARNAKNDLLILDRGVLQTLYKNLGERLEVPGFITLRANRSLGSIVGPVGNENSSFPVNTVIYIRWRGSSRPEIGEVFSVYTPAVVLQSKNDYSDFKIRQNKAPAKDDLDRFDHAGYLYETNGEIEILDVSRGIVKARVINNTNSISLNDQIMTQLPRFEKISPLESPIRMTAAIVAGSPYEKLLASLGGFIYLNRGRRDGVKVGTVFQTINAVKLLDSPAIKASHELGEAMVVYASDAFSTAIITKQFSMIRVGSLLETARPGLNRESQFKALTDRRSGEGGGEPQSEGYLSELDKIEKDSDILALSPEERERLERLHQQELRRRRAGSAFPNEGESAALPAPGLESGGVPELPDPPSIAAARKKREEARKKRLKQRKNESRKRDEEDLNQLFSE